MLAVLVNSPGRQPGPHWSDAACLDVARELRGLGADVEWLRVAVPSPPPAPVAGVTLRTVEAPRTPALHRVGAGMQHLAVERELARLLRARSAAVVLHVGLGAGGSPNVLWLAERMGSRPFAVVRPAEVMCQRGDLVDAAGKACTRHDDAATCRRCCARSWWARPAAVEFHNRWDLLFAGLLVAEAVFVDGPDPADHLASAGVPQRRLVVGAAADAIARRLTGR